MVSKKWFQTNSVPELPVSIPPSSGAGRFRGRSHLRSLRTRSEGRWPRHEHFQGSIKRSCHEAINGLCNSALTSVKENFRMSSSFGESKHLANCEWRKEHPAVYLTHCVKPAVFFEIHDRPNPKINVSLFNPPLIWPSRCFLCLRSGMGLPGLAPANAARAPSPKGSK
jgi:hypothetical protein